MSCYLLIGDVQIPLEDTYFRDIHLPSDTFQRIVKEHKLDVVVHQRESDVYPFEYHAVLNGIDINMLAEVEYLYD